MTQTDMIVKAIGNGQIPAVAATAFIYLQKLINNAQA